MQEKLEKCIGSNLENSHSGAPGLNMIKNMIFFSSKQNVIPWTESAILWQILCRWIVVLVLVVSILMLHIVVLFFCINFCNISFCINDTFCSAGNFCCFPLETRCRNRRFLKIIQVIMICSVTFFHCWGHRACSSTNLENQNNMISDYYVVNTRYIRNSLGKL